MHVGLPENEKIKKRRLQITEEENEKKEKKEQDTDMFANENFNERREM